MPTIFKPEDNIRTMNIPKKKLEPRMDMMVSKIIGKKILAQDPRLIGLVVKWKGNKPNDSEKPDNFFRDPEFIKELRKVLNGPI